MSFLRMHKRFRRFLIMLFAFFVLVVSAAAGAEPSHSADPGSATLQIPKERAMDAAGKAEALRQRGFRAMSVGQGEGGTGIPKPGSAGEAEATGGVDREALVQVTVREGTAPEDLPFAAVGARLVRSFPRIGVCTLAVPADRVERTIAVLEHDARVVSAAPPAERTFSAVPDDEFYERQWPLPLLGFPEAWDISTGRPDVVIAVLDSGVAYEIPDFAGKIVKPYSIIWNTDYWPAWEDVSGHGSAVASIAAARGNDSGGIAGAAWDVSIMPVHLSDGSAFSVDAEVAGILYAVDNGAEVINISAGSPIPDPAEEAAIEYALERGVVVVASAGNGGEQGAFVQYPAAYPGVIGVGAIQRDGRPAAFSATGAGLDFLAPGVTIPAWTADVQSIGVHDDHTGTSFAAPFVSGLAALLRSVDDSLSGRDVAAILRSTAEDPEPGWDHETGSGVIAAAAALAAASGGAEPLQVFGDVPAGHPYAEAVAELSAAGVIDGFGDGTFRPEERVSRQQFAKMILLALGRVPNGSDPNPFVDVPAAPGLYPDDYVALAYRLGITKGTSVDPPEFSPYAPIRRAQVITMITRAADSLRPGSLERTPDAYRVPFRSFSRDHDSAAYRAFWNGLLDGVEGMGSGYDFWQGATRGEVAQMLAGLVELEPGD